VKLILWIRRATLLLCLTLYSGLAAAQIARVENPEKPPLLYTISLEHRNESLVEVQVQIPPGAARHELQLPVWNALYQIRDFSQYVNWVKAHTKSGQDLTVRLLDKSRWQIEGAEGGAVVEYEIYANLPGPFGAQLNTHHAFLNLAEILMYPVDDRTSLMGVRFVNLPPDWKVATALLPSIGNWFEAKSYDRLVDSPVEISNFREVSFEQGGGHYRIVVDADPADYDMERLQAVVQGITASATEWMGDRPFAFYTFLYHFPNGPSGGGMEHAESTAININAQALRDNPASLADVTSHEFFHLWNVKRIRPQSLEPVDYTQENYSRSLWFCEGVTSTAANLVLLRAGMIDANLYLQRLTDQINQLERRPARLQQSAERSSLDAWLEKYPYYRMPERSISYYNKGEILGVLLDLKMREASHDAVSLVDLFHWLNENYAKKGRFFADDEGLQQAVEALTHADFREFFQKYVVGTEEIPWDEFFAGVGLHAVRSQIVIADPGFTAARDFEGPVAVLRVTPGSAAEQAGLRAGDLILQLAGKAPSIDIDDQISGLRPGEILELQVRSRTIEKTFSFPVGSRQEIELSLKDADHVSPQQAARRTAWQHGESQAGAHP
jgi:predicted metalloprotease with PDZ domain